MEFVAEVSSSTNIYNTLSGDTATTFTKEEIELNGVYNDVWQYTDTDDREEQKRQLSINSDRSIKKEHPSKEFVLSGGLRGVVQERVVQEQKKKTIPFTGQGHVLGGIIKQQPQVTTLQNLNEYQPFNN